MSMKQGGRSWHQNVPSKKGMTQQAKCSICGRQYKQKWTAETHEKRCQEHNKGQKT